jgi:hypothetical protein
MRRFVKNIILFVSPMLLIVISLDSFLKNQKTTYSFKYEGLKSNTDSIEVLVLGNSRSCYGINPSEFTSKTYNLANVSQTLYFDKRLTLDLLDNMPKLKFVLISIDYHSLYTKSQTRSNTWSYLGNKIKFEDTDYHLVDISPTIFGYNLLVTISFLKKYILHKIQPQNGFFLMDMEADVKKDNSINDGFFYLEGTDEISFRDDKYITNRGQHFENLTNDTTQIREVIVDLEDFISVLQSKGITPILITNPLHQTFFEKLNKDKLDKNKQLILNICSKHGLNYWDFSATGLFQTSDFKNPDHLNLFGANKFSIILNDSINKFNTR